MKRVIVVVVALTLGNALPDAREARAEKPYASAGVIELGGAASISYQSRATTPEGGDEGPSTSTTSINLQPTVGYFIIPSLQVFGGVQLQIEKESTEDEDDDLSGTGFGALVGAGYYIPAGTVFIGPRAAVGYGKATVDDGTTEASATNLSAQVAGALRIPFGWGGLLDLAAILQYDTVSLEVEDEAVGDASGLAFGAQVGFFVFF